MRVSMLLLAAVVAFMVVYAITGGFRLILG